jgi:hypothetical protein
LHQVVTDAYPKHIEECVDFLKNPEENDSGDAALYGLSE